MCSIRKPERTWNTADSELLNRYPEKNPGIFLFFCDHCPGNPVYEGVRAKESPKEIKNMTKTFIAAAAVIAMLAGTAAQADNKEILGGWTEAQETEITPEIQEIFDEAADKLIGVDYEAIELLETQIVNGTNYKFLAESRVVYPGAEKKTVIVTVYRDLAGNVSVLDIE